MIAWGVICIIFALVNIQTISYTEYGIGAVIFWAALGSVLIARGISKKREQAQLQAQQQTVIVNNYTMPAASGGQIVRNTSALRATASVYQPKLFPVAGVTFQNDDGSSRQQILREICAGDEEGNTEAWLEWYQFNGRDAYRVMTPLGCVGNVRKNDVREAVTAIGAGKVDLDVELFETEDGRQIYRADLSV